MSRLILPALAAALFGAAPALANDSTAALGAGGLTLPQSADVRMASEDLFVSRELNLRAGPKTAHDPRHVIGLIFNAGDAGILFACFRSFQASERRGA